MRVNTSKNPADPVTKIVFFFILLLGCGIFIYFIYRVI